MLSPIGLIRRFGRSETGSVMAETVIVLPILLWSFLALFVYWDSFRSMNTVQKAAYTISDTISREMITLPSSYFDGLRNVMDFMIDSDQDVRMRITSFTYNKTELKYKVMWSYSPNNAMPELTTAQLVNLEYRLPNMADADYATILETEVDYKPAFRVFMDDLTLQQFIVTRPRFVSPTCMNGRTCNAT